MVRVVRGLSAPLVWWCLAEQAVDIESPALHRRLNHWFTAGRYVADITFEELQKCFNMVGRGIPSGSG